MDHEPHIGLVDPHAECDRRHHHPQVVPQECLLHLRPFSVLQPRMIGSSGNPRSLQPFRHLFDPLSAQRIDDARIVPPRRQKVAQLIERFPLLDHLVADVGAVEAGHEARLGRYPQAPHDVVSCLGIGGGGDGHDRRLGEESPQPAELGVLGAEIVPPLGNAVSLINGEKRDRDTGKPLQELVPHQALRRDIEQVQLVFVQGGEHPAGFAG